jgi:glycosyltransferase involved in cell wall biosynthesis
MRGIGGSERHLLALLPALQAVGIEPAFVGLDDPAWDAEPFYEALGEIPVVRLRARGDVEAGLPWQLARALRRLRPDVVHTHLVHADVYGAFATTAPLVSTKHNDDPFRTGAFRHVERLLALRAKRIVAITQSLKRFLVDRAGLPERKIDVVHYGLDEVPHAWAAGGTPTVSEDATVLLSVSRLVEQKGVDVAIRALPAVLERRPGTVLVVLGEGPERERLTALARELGVGAAVHLPGRVGDVAAWYRRADVLVHTARWEGFGLAILEGMLAGLPVVAGRVSSVPELVVDGATGVLVSPDDPRALAAGVLEALQRAEELGRAGRARARAEFSVERMARRTIEVYERAR